MEKKEDWDQMIIDFYPQRKSLVAVGPVVLLHNRPVIPESLLQTTLMHLDAGHQGANAMFERASTTLYWPKYRADIVNHRAACATCSKYQPSNPAMPHPVYPFQSKCADFCTINSWNYLTIVDRFSNWFSILIETTVRGSSSFSEDM